MIPTTGFKRLIYGPWPTSRNFRLGAYGLVVVAVGFGLAWIADTLDWLVLLAGAVAVMLVGLAFNFYLSFSKDRPDGE